MFCTINGRIDFPSASVRCRPLLPEHDPHSFFLTIRFILIFTLLVLLLSDCVYSEPWPFAPLCVAPPEFSPCISGERTPYALPALYLRRCNWLVLTVQLTQLQGCASDWRPTLSRLFSDLLLGFFLVYFGCTLHLGLVWPQSCQPLA